MYWGAPEFVMQSHFSEVEQELLPYTKKGYRVLIFARYAGRGFEKRIDGRSDTIGLYCAVQSNPCQRKGKHLRILKAQGVQIKVISGDNPETVSEIAKQAGIEGRKIILMPRG